MDEQFLHFIWKYQKFVNNPVLTNGQELKIFYPGNHNHDSGPDFEEARIKIGSMEWAGQVEVHINSSDWIHHNHSSDKAYENAILHVVWNHDKEIVVKGETLPTLELKHLVDLALVEKYKRHIKSVDEILCSSQLRSISPLTISGMLDRVLVERLNEKSDQILTNLKKSKNDWEEVTFKTLTTNFGFATNKEAFNRLTQVLPFSVLKKGLQNITTTEALIFGQAGFLEQAQDEYQQKLKEEFSFYTKKFNLKTPLSKVQWKFGKLRPANFPTVRLAQLASLFHHHPQLFSTLIHSEDSKELKKKLLVTVSDYWQNHYDFNKKRRRPIETMGTSSFNGLLINTVVPLLDAYSRYTDEQKYMDRAIELLESLDPESNRFTKKWDGLIESSQTAFDSQAQIQLYKQYCLKRRCLKCNIGVEILNR
ncbi:DUF2851 family protein [Ekhidna sp.]|uniref:DUF2851 family protein n=1 Tax=Ekhidna sp. TaxID=2608089 RepID=UPI00351523C6